MTSKETQDRAVTEIRRAAVSQPHAVRRLMMRYADIMGGGVDVTSSPLTVSMPLRKDGKITSWVEVVYFRAPADGEPSARLTLLPPDYYAFNTAPPRPRPVVDHPQA